MNGFTKLLPPMDGWKCNFCGALTHYPDEHTEKCRTRREAEIDRLKAEVKRLRKEVEAAKLDERERIRTKFIQYFAGAGEVFFNYLDGDEATKECTKRKWDEMMGVEEAKDE